MLAQSRGEAVLLPATEAGKGKYNAKLLEAIDWAMEVNEQDRPQTVDAWRQALAGGGRRKSQTKAVRKTAAKLIGSRPTERTGTSWSTIALTLVIIALLGAGAWWGLQKYPELFGQGSGEVPMVTEQPAQTDIETVSADATETEEAVASAEQPASKAPALSPEEAEVARLLAAAEADGGCGGYRPDDEGWDRGNRPVINVSWDDAQSFIDWLNDKTGGNFRLPTEAEWEYAVRAGSTTKFHSGNAESQQCWYANHADTSTDYDWRNMACSDDVGKRTAAVGRYKPNNYNLYDMHGNVWEWIQDCWNGDYAGAPIDGQAWMV